ncbi:cytochrome c biogenesis protein CcsA [uncultured Bacteroides sp.]|uniref:cytochrome c biogenesis protein CcsA n=1 Tax=uncultured Bacteroides sp. TaxID=162156 RepID=UPI0026075FDF|nr:cytochrome c biogenesis protein CcsA [uncultured Bacteroides sp.]
MKQEIFKTTISFLSSYKITIALMIVYGILLGTATFIEKYYGVDMAKSIYYSPLIGIIWLLMIVNWILLIIRNHTSVKRKFGYYMLHASFVFILSGAMFSHFKGVEGLLHVREGEQTNEIITNRNTKIKLPFQVYLNDFQLVRYPGSNSPRSYKSIVTIYEKNSNSKMEVYMNKVISVQGYRLFQTAYDEDEAGTILTVSYDPIGMTITYIGYTILLLGIILIPFQRESRLRILLGKLKLISLLLLFPFCSIEAHSSWKDIQIQNPNGRIEPMDTYCRALTRKIHHSEKVNSTEATEFILGLMGNPGYWNDQPIIYQSNKEIQKDLGKEGNFLCFNDLFDSDGNYILKDEITKIYNTPVKLHDKRQKDLLKLDEKLNIMLSIEQGQMLQIFPLPGDERERWFSPGDDLSAFSGDDSMFVSHIMPWYFTEPSQEIVDMISKYQKKKTNTTLLSEAQVSLEIIYNKIRPFFYTAIINLSCGLLLLLSIFIKLIHNKSSLIRTGCRIFTYIIILSFIIHTSGLIIRWYISGQAPWSNAYESMVYAAWCTLGGSIIFMKRSPITLALGAFFSGIILLVSNMNWMDPVITPLVPVLQSYWLMIHVAVIMSGYGFLAIGFLLGLTNLAIMIIPRYSDIIDRQLKEISIINEISLILGLCLMTAGTFLGAIWANEAWGRYWGWDPKETWALITILIYVVITHARFIPKLNNPFALSAMSVFGFSTVLMTYLGVNYFLSGMHSYGSGNAPFEIYFFIIVYIMLSIVSVLAYHSYKRRLVFNYKK